MITRTSPIGQIALDASTIREYSRAFSRFWLQNSTGINHREHSMADEVKIDRDQFHSRLGQLLAAWRTDRRASGDAAVFGGVTSMVVLMGRNEEGAGQLKNSALHVGISSTSRSEEFWLFL